MSNPSQSDRQKAVDRMQKNLKEHLEKQGKHPTSREIEKTIGDVARQADRIKKW